MIKQRNQNQFAKSRQKKFKIHFKNETIQYTTKILDIRKTWHDTLGESSTLQPNAKMSLVNQPIPEQ